MTISTDEIERLGRDRNPGATDLLRPLLRDENIYKRVAAATALGRIGGTAALEDLIEALADSSPDVRQSAAWALGTTGHDAAVDPLVGLLRDPFSKVRSAAIWALERLGQARVLPALEDVLRFDADARVRQTAKMVVETIISDKERNRVPEPGAANSNLRRAQQSILVALLVICFLGLLISAIYLWDQPLGPRLMTSDQVASPVASFPTAEYAGSPQCGGPRTMFLLLVGTDRDEEGFETGSADIIRVARIDFVRMRTLVLAVPRDLWVTIPGLEAYGISENRIKTAYPYGNHYEVPGRGVSLLAKTLLTNFGLGVEHYAVIDFATFANGIDELGGVDIQVPETIGVQGTGEYIAQGLSHLDGQMALAYARARPGNSSDLARIDRQSQIILAARDKVLSPEGIKRLPAVVETMRASAHTDLSASQLSSLLCLVQSMKPSNLILTTLKEDYFVRVTDSFGYERLLPDIGAIRRLSAAFMQGDVEAVIGSPDN